MFRIGHGYDVHKLVEGRKLILGGVDIPHTTGLLGHSDADVLLHAVMDAMLGALALGDIGHLFPDTDENFKDADSMKLLEKVYFVCRENGYKDWKYRRYGYSSGSEACFLHSCYESKYCCGIML